MQRNGSWPQGRSPKRGDTTRGAVSALSDAPRDPRGFVVFGTWQTSWGTHVRMTSQCHICEGKRYKMKSGLTAFFVSFAMFQVGSANFEIAKQFVGGMVAKRDNTKQRSTHPVVRSQAVKAAPQSGVIQDCTFACFSVDLLRTTLMPID